VNSNSDSFKVLIFNTTDTIYLWIRFRNITLQSDRHMKPLSIVFALHTMTLILKYTTFLHTENEHSRSVHI